MNSQYNTFKADEVRAESLEDFCNRYFKSSSWAGRDNGYRTAVLESMRDDLEKYGYTIISHHDSITGTVVSYYA